MPSAARSARNPTTSPPARKGFPSAIEQAREAGIEIISLEVRADNLGAIALYRSFGFEEIGFFRRFGKIGGAYYDALLMNL